METRGGSGRFFVRRGTDVARAETESLVNGSERLDGDVVRPRLASGRRRAEADAGGRGREGPSGPRGRRQRSSGGVVAVVTFPPFLAGDVAQGDRDQYRDRDPHPDADPYDLLVYPTVPFP